MEVTTYTTRVLVPTAEGGMITQAEDVKITDRLISDEVFLAVNDDPENWREITAEEAEEYKRQIEEARQAEMEAILAEGLSGADN